MYYLFTVIFWALSGFGNAGWDILSSLLFMPPFHNGWNNPPFFGYAVLYPGWTLNYEMWFYVIFTVSLLCGKFRWLALIIFLCFPIAFMQFAAGHWTLSPFDAPIASFPYLSLISNPLLLEFPAGIVLGVIYTSAFRLPLWLAQCFAAISCIGFICLYIGNHFHGHGILHAGLPAFALFLSLLLYEKCRPLRLGRAASKMADASYILYLIHPMIVGQLASCLISRIQGWPLFTGCVAISIILAFVLHALIEMPVSGWLKRRLLPPRSG